MVETAQAVVRVLSRQHQAMAAAYSPIFEKLISAFQTLECTCNDVFFTRHCTMEHTDRTPLDISGSIPFLSVSKAVSCSAILGLQRVLFSSL